MKRLSVAVSLTILTWACDVGSRTPSPTSPSAPPAPAAPRATYTLSGIVSEVTSTGYHRPVEGARVEEINLHLPVWVWTDKNGFYSIPGRHAGTLSLSVTLEGYEAGKRDVAINGDTQLDIQLVPRATFTLSGVVFEVTPTGLQVTVEGVWVTESYFHAGVWTDRNGFYSFRGPFGTGLNDSIGVSKEGYESGWRDVTINGDTRLDVQIVRR